MFRKRTFWIALVVLALLGGGGAAYAYWLAPQETPQGETTIETATVTVGDISITADGTGMLVPLSETELAFGAAAAVGIFFGYYPALKAAQLDPIVALPRE